MRIIPLAKNENELFVVMVLIADAEREQGLVLTKIEAMFGDQIGNLVVILIFLLFAIPRHR